MDDLKKFEARTSKSTGCWEWTGHVTRIGYGMMWFRRRSHLAHRVSWELHRGSIPDDMDVLHKCDNRKCVNPSHLFLGDQFANMADMAAKGRSPDRVGEKHPKAILTEDDVRKIRASDMSLKAIMFKFGISKSGAHSARSGKTWSHI